MTPLQIAPGLPDLAQRQAEVGKRVAETKGAKADIAKNEAGLKTSRVDLLKIKGDLAKQTGEAAVAGKARYELAEKELSQKEAALKANQSALKTKADELTADQTALALDIEGRRGNIQRWQELGGLTGRIIFALLLTLVPSQLLLRLFLVPGVFLFPLTYLVLRGQDYNFFAIGVFVCGLLTVSQMSYMSEYLPKVFPVHLRGTGGGFATNVGARMLGTMAATFNTEFLSQFFDGPNPVKVATAAAIIGGTAFLVALVLSFFLPPPRAEEPVSASKG
jgi:hypothetical protein